MAPASSVISIVAGALRPHSEHRPRFQVGATSTTKLSSSNDTLRTRVLARPSNLRSNVVVRPRNLGSATGSWSRRLTVGRRVHVRILTKWRGSRSCRPYDSIRAILLPTKPGGEPSVNVSFLGIHVSAADATILGGAAQRMAGERSRRGFRWPISQCEDVNRQLRHQAVLTRRVPRCSARTSAT
jgi:hypothetical protein